MEMVRVMVYHHDAQRLRLLCQVIAGYFQAVRHSYNLVAYRKWEEAQQYLREDGRKSDIVFVDGSDLSGAVKLVKQLRRDNDYTSWVFMDGALKSLLQTLLLRPSMYLPDSANQKQVGAAIQTLDQYHQTRRRKTEFCFKYEGEILRIPYEQISYFESSAKKVTLHLTQTGRIYHFTAKLDDIASRLPDQFLRCHQSYLVNLGEVRMLDSKEHLFVMRSEEEVFISRRSYTEVRQRYQDYRAGVGHGLG